MKVWSAGSRPTAVRPEAIATLGEIGIDISTHRSKAVSEIPAAKVDTVITLFSRRIEHVAVLSDLHAGVVRF